ncbi:ATP-dependent Lon protease [Candidatus Hakubella thermalkaliphila]|uniref:Lon protease n=4 Tax=Candidatus Hakubella thermalkaliphila TaxID=2754717 RepID=A0A6V8NFP7_9ACTN|nr:endopeptidase La [Candidatus Hakubella thermalkaliphila]GFP19092.1 ATP-dependent Lon protease [Candidatus Hakubella thermalkaliphila]GFP42486.1 ATP-dependent Lon protease [Candidatus Hakubella thermalkaliphila]
MKAKKQNPENIRIPTDLPVVALKNTVIFPYLAIPLLIGRGKSLSALDEALKRENLIVLVCQKEDDKEDISPEDLYQVGTVSLIKQTFKLPDNSVKCVVEGMFRVRIRDCPQTEPHFTARIEILEDVEEVDREELENIRLTIQAQIENFLHLGIPFPADLLSALSTQQSLGRLADLLASYLLTTKEEKQQILEEAHVGRRLEKLSNFLGEELRKLRLQSQIMSKVQEEMGKTQREYFLRQQLKAIQEELGETDEGTAEINDLRKRLEEKKMPEEVQKKAMKELDRLARIPSASPEHSWIRTYLEWMIDVPWTERTDDKIDIQEAKKILDQDHYDLEKVKEHILDFLAVIKLKGEIKGPILCFVGPPGVGKTSLGQSIARALGRKFYRMSLGGIRDEAEIRGHRRTYVGALPGRIVQGIAQVGAINPVFMLDEIDKVGADFRGDPSAALLEVLDPEQNKSFTDNYLAVPYDLSQVMFICTANVVETIIPALLDRMEVLRIPGYTRDEKLRIARRHLVPKQIKEQGLTEYQVTFSDQALYEIIDQYTREAGVRNLEREISNICRKVAREIVTREKTGLKVSAKDVEKFLGVPKISPSQIEDEDKVGVATGVAVTPIGGDILLVEATIYSGEGKLILTGQLGDVMQESAKAALSYVESKADEFGLTKDFFKKTDIHIHVPEGAIPKDGPSAGITMLVALISAVTKKPVKRDVGMTGEITLRGRILPVGGIKSKLLAAHRAGIKTFVLPAKNEKDLTEIPREIKSSLDIKLADNVDDVLQYTFVEEAKVTPLESQVSPRKRKPVTVQVSELSG